ncbi:MAG TPA: methionine--tRNA ligase [Patescibacteria group bacterium]|nr:methionine--tRNA ligase [Patescibacteria group bacterium]
MKYYITTTLPYVNAEPHIGFALEIIQADVLARFHRQNGDEVFFNTGTDEHGLKIYRKAQELGIDPQKYCDEYAAKFDNLKAALNLSYDNFIRTTDGHHIAAAQAFWQLCEKNGDIYKKNYQIKYCVGCELEKTESELAGGKCPIHPNLDLELIDEENYFFRFSKYQQSLLKLYSQNKEFVVPEWRQNEITNFVTAGLEDFSVSRLKEKMPWGIPVPGDEAQVMYVWFDALVNYISCLGWPCHCERVNKLGADESPDLALCQKDSCNYKKFWPGFQVAGKDNLRQQSAMWQAMLLSAGLPTSKQVMIHGFITAGGQKMSKSLGNVVNPFELVEKFGTDAVRYYLLAKLPPFEDGDYTEEKFKESYTADLCNGLGNLVSRVSNLIDKNNLSLKLDTAGDGGMKESFDQKLSEYKFNEALEILWTKLRACDEAITRTEPWKIKDQAELKKVLKPIAQDILNVAALLRPFMPTTADKIIQTFAAEKIVKSEILFPRI